MKFILKGSVALLLILSTSSIVSAQFCNSLEITSIPSAPKIDLNDPSNLSSDNVIIQIEGTGLSGPNVFGIVSDINNQNNYSVSRLNFSSTAASTLEIPKSFLNQYSKVSVKLATIEGRSRCYSRVAELDIERINPNCNPCSQRITENCDGDIVYSADGAVGDPDDWLASAASAIALAKNNLLDRLVHYHYGSDLFDLDPLFYQVMTNVSTFIRNDLNVSQDKLYDAYYDTQATVAHFAEAIEDASYCNPVTIVQAGGYHVTNLAFDLAAIAGESTFDYINFVSHSVWNDRWDSFGQGMTMVDLFNKYPVLSQNYTLINDQNSTAWNSNTTPNAFDFMIGTDAQIVYDHSILASLLYWWSRNDSSDTGMIHWLLTGNENATLSELRNFLFGL